MSSTKLNQEMINLMFNEDKNLNRFEDSLSSTHKRIVDCTKDSVALKDEYGNSLLSIGTSDKVNKFDTFNFENDTLNFYLWLSLYNDSWVFRRAIDKPAQDEIRCGITLQGQQDKTKIYRLLKKHRFDLIQLLQWGALFGGAIACMMFDNIKDEDYAKPMNYSVLKKSKTMKMYVVDRWYGVSPSSETVDNMSDLDFGKPKYYDVTMANGHTITFHHSWVIRYEHRTAPQLIKKGMLQGWGYAEGAHILNEIARDEKLKASIQSLINKSLIEVIKMSGMRGVFMGSDVDNQDQLRKRLEMVNWARDFNSLTFLDKDDDYIQHSYGGLGGLSDLLEKNMWLISAALEMQGVLFGDLKQGFANDAEALERYDETINGRCESYVRPVYTKLLTVLYKIENITDKVEFTFNSMLSKQQTEKQVQNVKDYVSLLSQLLNDGIITVKQYAQSLVKYTNDSVIDLCLTEADIEKLDDEINNEDFNLDV